MRCLRVCCEPCFGTSWGRGVPWRRWDLRWIIKHEEDADTREDRKGRPKGCERPVLWWRHREQTWVQVEGTKDAKFIGPERGEDQQKRSWHPERGTLCETAISQALIFVRLAHSEQRQSYTVIFTHLFCSSVMLNYTQVSLYNKEPPTSSQEGDPVRVEKCPGSAIYLLTFWGGCVFPPLATQFHGISIQVGSLTVEEWTLQSYRLDLKLGSPRLLGVYV